MERHEMRHGTRGGRRTEEGGWRMVFLGLCSNSNFNNVHEQTLEFFFNLLYVHIDVDVVDDAAVTLFLSLLFFLQLTDCVSLC